MVDHFLLDTLHFVAQHHGIAFPLLQPHVFQHDTVFGLLYRKHYVAFPTQVINSFNRVINILPVDREFGSQGRLVHLGMGRSGRNAAQIDALHTESIRRTENRTDVVQAAHVVKYHNQRQFVGLLELFGTDAVQFGNLQFTMLHKLNVLKLLHKDTTNQGQKHQACSNILPKCGPSCSKRPFSVYRAVNNR